MFAGDGAASDIDIDGASISSTTVDQNGTTVSILSAGADYRCSVRTRANNVSSSTGNIERAGFQCYTSQTANGAASDVQRTNLWMVYGDICGEGDCAARDVDGCPMVFWISIACDGGKITTCDITTRNVQRCFRSENHDTVGYGASTYIELCVGCHTNHLNRNVIALERAATKGGFPT